MLRASGEDKLHDKKMKKRSKYYIDLHDAVCGRRLHGQARIVTGPPKKASAPKVTSATPSGKQVTVPGPLPPSTGVRT